MADHANQPTEIPEGIRVFAHSKSADELALLCLLGVTENLVLLLGAQKKRDEEAISEMYTFNQVIRAKLALLGYLPPDSVKFVP